MYKCVFILILLMHLSLKSSGNFTDFESSERDGRFLFDSWFGLDETDFSETTNSVKSCDCGEFFCWINRINLAKGVLTSRSFFLSLQKFAHKIGKYFKYMSFVFRLLSNQEIVLTHFHKYSKCLQTFINFF